VIAAVLVWLRPLRLRDEEMCKGMLNCLWAALQHSAHSLNNDPAATVTGDVHENSDVMRCAVCNERLVR
jgi:hypothetical protein